MIALTVRFKNSLIPNYTILNQNKLFVFFIQYLSVLINLEKELPDVGSARKFKLWVFRNFVTGLEEV